MLMLQSCKAPNYIQHFGLAMWRNSVVRLTVAEAKLLQKCSLFIPSPGVIRLPDLKSKCGQKLRIYSLPRQIAKPVIGSCFC